MEHRHVAALCVLLTVFFPGAALAQRELHFYRDHGFNPVDAIKSELDARVQLLLEPGDSPGPSWLTSVLWFLACAAMFAGAWYLGGTDGAGPLWLAIGALAVAGIARIAGVVFRTRMDWGRTAALFSLLPAIMFAAATAAFLWRARGRNDTDLSRVMMAESVALSLWVTNSSIRGMRSRKGRAAVALRKKLTAAWQFFRAELQRPHPALRDGWYPWVLAFGLSDQADAWSTGPAAIATSTDGSTLQSERPSTDSASPRYRSGPGSAEGDPAPAAAPRGRRPPPGWPPRCPPLQRAARTAQGARPAAAIPAVVPPAGAAVVVGDRERRLTALAHSRKKAIQASTTCAEPCILVGHCVCSIPGWREPSNETSINRDDLYRPARGAAARRRRLATRADTIFVICG